MCVPSVPYAFPHSLLRSCRHADGCRRVAADCALPDAAAEAWGNRVSNSHSATTAPPRARAAGPAPLRTCTRFSPALLALVSHWSRLLPVPPPEAFRRSRFGSFPVRGALSRRWGGSVTTLAGRGAGAKSGLHETPSPPGRREPASLRGGSMLAASCSGGVWPAQSKKTPYHDLTSLLSSL